MLGAIIGDIVGSRFEFGPAPEKDFELFTDECSYTDDTICTVAIADAILSGRSYKDALLDWCHRYPAPMGGYGNMFYDWLHEDNPQPKDSFGNGSAMRVSPVGWLFSDWEEVIAEAKKTAEISHNHEEGIKGAQCVYGAQNEAYRMMEGRKVGKVVSLQRVMRSLTVEAPQNETFTLV